MSFYSYFNHPFMDADTGSTGMAANDGEVAELQQDNPDNTGDIDNVEPAQSTEPTEPQEDITQTQAFAYRLKEEKQKAIDAEYDRLYGQDYDIHSKAEYDIYVARKKAMEEGKDPEVVDLRNNLNQTQAELQELRFERTLITQREKLQQDPLYKEWEPEINDRMKQYDELFKTGQINQRVDLETAYTLMWKEKGPQKINELKQKLEIDQANKDNAASGTGSVKGQGKIEGQYYTPDQVRTMSQQEILANYNAIQESKKLWYK